MEVVYVKSCVTCGVAEDRRKDAQGRELTNIDPVSGKCLRCLVVSSMARPKQMSVPLRDVKQAQTGDRE